MSKKILIIEDEADLANNLSLGLSKYFEVEIAGNGKEGLAKAKTLKPDLIFLDIMLPDISGPDVLLDLKKEKETADTPVIVLTNVSDTDMISQILMIGGKEYLIKTDWSLDQIVAKAQSMLQ